MPWISRKQLNADAQLINKAAEKMAALLERVETLERQVATLRKCLHVADPELSEADIDYILLHYWAKDLQGPESSLSRMTEGGLA